MLRSLQEKYPQTKYYPNHKMKRKLQITNKTIDDKNDFF